MRSLRHLNKKIMTQNQLRSGRLKVIGTKSPVSGIKLCPLTQGKVAKVCDCHYDLVKNFKWFYKRDNYDGYACRQTRIIPYGLGRRGIKYQRTLPMHRLIINAPPDILVDHINRDKLDNRCSNLRLVDFSINIMNR